MARDVRVSSESVWAVAFCPVVDHLTLGIGTAGCWTVARVLAAVQNTGFIVAAVFVFPATNNAISVQTDFFVKAVFVLQTALDAVAIHTKLTGCTFVPL